MNDTELSTLVRRELDKRGIRGLKQAARYLGVSTELVRVILSNGHVPRDRTLIGLSRVLGLDPAVLILAGHRQKLPRELHDKMLTVAPSSSGTWEQKRKWPLSQEQCEYLGRVMQPHEIQLIRKYRRLTGDEKQQAAGYVDYMFATRRVPPPGEQAGEGPSAAPEGAVLVQTAEDYL